MIKKLINNKINNTLNSKEIRCIGCNKLINFTDKKESEDIPYISNFNHYVCTCGETDQLDGLAYISLNIRKDMELIQFLNEAELFSIGEISNTDDLQELYHKIETNLSIAKNRA